MADEQPHRDTLLGELEQCRREIAELESLLEKSRRAEKQLRGSEVRLRESEARLRESEARLSTAVESLPFDFFLLDKDGRYALLNASSRRHWGDIRGRLPEDICPDGETLALWQKNNERAFAGEVVAEDVEMEIGGQTGHYHNIISPIRDGNEIRGILGVNIDITEKAEMLSALKESEENFRLLAENAQDGIIIASSEGGHVFANRGMAEITGYSVEELLALDLSKLAHPDEIPKLAEALRRRFEGTLEPGSYETVIVRKDGSNCPVEVTGSKTRWHGVEGDIVIVRDITERKKADDELRRRSEELARLYEQTRRDADKRAVLLREVNHRVNNNLANMISMIRLEKGIEPAGPGSEFGTLVEKLVNRIQGLATVHRMLASTEWSPLNLGALAEQIISSATRGLSDRTAVEVTVEPTAVLVPPEIAHNLALLFNELASNSTKHAFAGRDRGVIAVRFSARGDSVTVEYADDGPGYPDDVLRRERENVGFELIRDIVANTFHGSLELRNRDGAVTTIGFRNHTGPTPALAQRR